MKRCPDCSCESLACIPTEHAYSCLVCGFLIKAENFYSNAFTTREQSNEGVFIHLARGEINKREELHKTLLENLKNVGEFKE